MDTNLHFFAVRFQAFLRKMIILSKNVNLASGDFFHFTLDEINSRKIFLVTLLLYVLKKGEVTKM